MKTALYSLLVNRTPAIRRKYQEARKEARSPGARVLLWGKLLLWNVEYWLPGKKRSWEKRGFPEKKNLVFRESESFTGLPQERLLEQLAPFPVISFDIFDTLLLRPFSSPTDLFYLLGAELHYPDFPVLRMLAEDQARKRNREAGGLGEVTLEEIWTCLEPLTAIPRETGIEAEKALEERYCLENPYFSSLIPNLKKEGKVLLAVSDMYLDKSFLQRLLEKYYGPVFDGILVSGEEGCSKAQGGLYEKVWEIGEQLLNKRKAFSPKAPEKRRAFSGKSRKRTWQIAHVGDHPHSDIFMARKAGLQAFLYPNPQDMGNPGRAFDMSPITGSLYRGLVNLKLHTGCKKYSVFYELGYVYGGLGALGFCQFIRRKVLEKGIQKVCFLARDGDVLKRAFDFLYPEMDTFYILWSRNVSARLAAERFPFDFFRRFLFQKVNQGYSMEKIFASMKLSCLLKEACRYLKCQETSLLTEKRALGCRDFLLEHWRQVTGIYRKERALAGAYLSQTLFLEKTFQNEPHCPKRKAAVVDIGWSGSGPLGLEYVLHQTLGHSWQVFTFLAAGSGAPSPDRDSAQSFFFEGKMDSYFFSQNHNRDLWRFHDLHKKHNLYLELLFTSPSPGFQGFEEDREGKVKLLFGPREGHRKEIAQIHKGILDFIKDYQKIFGSILQKNQGEISGRDAYAPFVLLLGDRVFQKKLEGAFHWDTRENVE